MPCGHPLAARRIVTYDNGKRLRTDCWACAMEADRISRIVGPAKRASIGEKRSVE